MQKYHDEPKQYKGYLKSALDNGSLFNGWCYGGGACSEGGTLGVGARKIVARSPAGSSPR